MSRAPRARSNSQHRPTSTPTGHRRTPSDQRKQPKRLLSGLAPACFATRMSWVRFPSAPPRNRRTRGVFPSDASGPTALQGIRLLFCRLGISASRFTSGARFACASESHTRSPRPRRVAALLSASTVLGTGCGVGDFDTAPATTRPATTDQSSTTTDSADDPALHGTWTLDTDDPNGAWLNPAETHDDHRQHQADRGRPGQFFSQCDSWMQRVRRRGVRHEHRQRAQTVCSPGANRLRRRWVQAGRFRSGTGLTQGEPT